MDTRDMDRRLVLTHYRGAKAAFLIEDDSLNGIWLETKEDHSRIGEIYVGKIKSVADGIGAAFVEYEKGMVGFLPLTQIKPDMILNRVNPDAITPEQELLVQVYKDPMKHKDATLTTDLLFSGKYLILTPVSPGIRFSRKLKKDQKKTLLHLVEQVLDELFGSSEVFLSRYGLIVRTNAIFAGFMELFYELHELFHNAGEVRCIAENRTAFSLLYKDSPFYQRVIRDQYDLPHIRIYTDDVAIKEELEPKQEWDYETNDPSAVYHLNEEEKKRYAAFLENYKQRMMLNGGGDLPGGESEESGKQTEEYDHST
ncbi:MAG: ribonuclease E/G, partial [Lachnospiraceae bacterium]|nr:ribonuclease E/G [Lachnospiraceae bacterium]